MRKQTCLLFAAICCLFIFSCDSCENIIKIVNQPTWTEQGPATITDTSVEGIKGEPSAGAINCILPHPANKEIMYVGTVNGGIWKTENAYSPSPDWVPLTDTLPSLSITHMVFDPLDDTYNTIYAGTGKLSSGAYLGGPELGIYYTTDGGANWRIIGGDDLKGKKVYKILALPTNTNNPKLPNLYVATSDGVYKNYGLDTFNLVLAGNAFDLAYDNENPANIFAAMYRKGIYHSNNNGTATSWDSLEIDGLDFRNQSNLKLDFANKELYVAEARKGDSKVRVFSAPAPYDKFSTLNSPTTLEGAIIGIGGEQFGPFPGDQSNTHFSFLVNMEGGAPVLYIGGDRNKKLRTLFFSSTGQGKSSGRIFKGTRKGAAVDWLPIVGAATHGTAPHADSRYLVFDSANHLLEADDGGVYRLSVIDKKLQWQSLNGNLRIAELYSVAWDGRTQSIVAGAQDVGSLEQIEPAFSSGTYKKWKAARLYAVLGQDLGDLIGSSSNLESDGGVVAVSDQDSFSIRYGMGNGLQVFVSRTYWNEINPNNVGANFYLFDYGCAGMFCALHPADTINTEGLNIVRYEVNRADPTRFVIGARGTYEFFHNGGSMTVIDTFRLTSNATSIAYGAPGQPELLYVAKTNEISLREKIGLPWIRRVYDDSLDFSGNIEDIAIDPDNTDNVYFITRKKVYRFNGFASDSPSIDTLTGNLRDGINGYSLQLKTLSVFKTNIKGEEKKLLLVGGYGGVYYNLPKENGGGESQLWLQYGEGLPNVVVRDLHYNVKDDVLVAGTWGRGAWTVANVSAAVPEVVFE
ncbi:MAG TPA: hypothetical protein ENJ95_19495 [Bacteroidetes bacterium]|nr:hypothetical protein [Bacteroidota bacterium]